MIPLLLFLAIPAAEIYLFIVVGGEIGTWPTIGMIFGTAMLGGTILRFQGRQMIARAREQVAKHELPIAEIADGAVLVLAAVFRLTPGFITDALGALLLIPFLRRLIFALLLLVVRARIQRAAGHAGPSGGNAGGRIIEGEFEDISDRDNPPPRPQQIDKD